MNFILIILLSFTFFILHFILYKKKIIKIKHSYILLFISCLLNIIFYNLCIIDMTFLNKIVFLALNLIVIYNIYYYKYLKNTKYFIILLAFSIAFCSEMFIFNIKHFETFNNKENRLEFNTSSNVKNNNNVLTFTNNEQPYLEFKNINKHIKSLKIDIQFKDSNIPVQIIPYLTDSSSKNYFELPERNISPLIVSSKYLVFDISGQSTNLKINFSNVNQFDTVIINDIIVNAKIPIIFTFYRFILLFFSILLIYAIRPNSSLYKYKTLEKFQFKNVVMITVCSILMLSVVIIINFNPAFKEKLVDSYEEYYLLSESLLKGKFYLEEKPSKTLLELKNPYDTVEREKMMQKNGDTYKWDWAYYNGKYYVYFGVVPCILVFLPFYVITKTHLPIYISIGLAGILSVIAILYFMKQLIKKYYPDIPFLIYLELSFLIFIASNLLYIFKRPCFYSIPIIYGLIFVFFGLGLWMDSLKENKINKIKLAFGSVFIGLTLGCRPQMFISSLLGFVIFLPYLKGKIKMKEKIKNIAISLVPIMIIMFLLGYYNYKRFGSPFDFGALYNLTVNDMTHKAKPFKLFFLGIYAYLFQPTYIKPLFPFIYASQIETNYLGNFYSEPFMGGLFYNNIILFMSMFILFMKDKFKNKNSYYFALITFIFGFIVLFIDTVEAGLLPRYIADFAYLFLITTVIVIMNIYSNLNKNSKKVFLKIVLFLIFLSSIYQFLFLFTDISVSLEENNPILFNRIAYFIQFWL